MGRDGSVGPELVVRGSARRGACDSRHRDLAIDDGGADGVFSAPVGRVHVGGPQEGEHGRELAVEMGREALGRGQGGRRVDEPAQAGEQAPMGHGEPLIGDRLRIAPIAEREGVGEDGLPGGRDRRAVVAAALTREPGYTCCYCTRVAALEASGCATRQARAAGPLPE